jgi:alpha-1,6-mannosyltransferase
VVAPSDGSIREIVTGDAGVVADPGVGGLAAAVAQVLTGDRHGQRLGARLRAEEFTWSASVERMLTIHRSVAAGASSLAG